MSPGELSYYVEWENKPKKYLPEKKKKGPSECGKVCLYAASSPPPPYIKTGSRLLFVCLQSSSSPSSLPRGKQRRKKKPPQIISLISPLAPIDEHESAHDVDDAQGVDDAAYENVPDNSDSARRYRHPVSCMRISD